MINTGYIRVFRSIIDKGWYKDSECVALWLHLLLKANHKGSEFMLGYKIVKLNPGQFVTGRKSLSFETGISESKIERILKLFENEQQIEQQTNSRNRIITILSWEKYQKSEQQVDSKWTASEQQVDTNNNDNNDNNEKNVILQFETFWNLYDNKTDRKKCFDKWNKLKEHEIEKILATVSDFKKHKPFPTYNHPNPLTYLNGQRWNDVLPSKQTLPVKEIRECDFFSRHEYETACKRAGIEPKPL